MPRPLTRALGALALTLAFAGLAALPPASAQTAQSPFLIVHVDLDAWNQGFTTSNMARCWNAPPVVQWRNTTLQQLATQLRQQSGLDLDALAQHLTGQLALVVAPGTPEPGAVGAPEPSVAIAVHQPGQIDALMATISAQLSPEQQAQLQSVTLRQGDTVVFGSAPTLNAQLAGAMEGGGPAALGLNAVPGAFLLGRLDFAPIYQMMQMPGGVSASEMAVINSLGFGNFQTVQLAMAFQDGGITGDAAIDFSGPRTGLVGLIGPNGPSGVMRLAPANAVTATGLRFAPPPQILDWIQQMVTQHGGATAAQEFQSGLAEFQTQTGFDLRTQLLPALGQEFGLIIGGAPTAAGQPGAPPPPMSLDAALLLEVTDPATINQFIAAMIQKANAAMAPVPQPAQPGQPAPPPPPPMINPVTASAGGVSYQVVAIPGMPFQICYGIVGSHLVIASTQTMMNALCETSAGGPSLAQSPGYQAMAAHVAPQAAMVSYSDNQRSASTMGQMLMPIMMMTGQMDPAAMQMLSQLPQYAQYMGTKVSAMTAEPSRLLVHSHDSSGAEIIVGAIILTTAAEAAMQRAEPPPAWQPAPAQAM